jgi:hypothetical protein
VRNLIPNVSGVLWRRDALLRALDAVPDIAQWRLAGDWRLYLALLSGAADSVVYIAEPLNVHRRHGDGVTQSLAATVHVAEISRMHEIAAKTLGLDGVARTAQAEYLGRVGVQLGAAKGKAAKTVARKRKV